MNMVASLKALLFATTPLGTVKDAPAATPDGAPDFSAMMNAATAAPVALPATAPDLSDHAPLPDATATDAAVPTDSEALPLPTTAPTFTPTQSAPIAAAPPLLAQSPLPITRPPAQPGAEPAEEAEPAHSAEQAEPLTQRPDDLPTAIGSVAQLLAASHIIPAEGAVTAPPPAPTLPVESDPTPGKPASKAQHHATLAQVAPSPVAPAAPSDTAPATDPEPASPDAEPERPEQSALAPPSPAMVMTPPAKLPPAAPDAPRVASPATVQTATVPVALGQSGATDQQSFAKVDLNQAAPPTAQPIDITAAPAPVAPAPAQAAPVAPASQPLGTPAIATPAAPIAQPAQPEAAPDPAPIATPVTMSSSVSAKAEALSLLQFARQHMSRHPAVSPVAEGSSAPTEAALAPATDALPKAAEPAAPAPVSPTLTTQTAAPALPTVNLSATLGAQVVDMGVSGQWIDGLARDIAGLSANGAQGRFQISSDQLGPIDVNIRQGIDGAAISLTVSSDMAEAALRQDSDRLRLDAGLSAVRISEVKIERAPQSSDAGRSDQSPQQQSGQQQSAQQNGQSANWQGAGQGMGQSQQQGRWQPRENIALAHKAGDDPAVLNHEQTGDTASQAIRARYA